MRPSGFVIICVVALLVLIIVVVVAVTVALTNNASAAVAPAVVPKAAPPVAPASVTCSRLEQNGNFGNQLFQIACVLSAAKKHKISAVFKKQWSHAALFDKQLPVAIGDGAGDREVIPVPEKATSHAAISFHAVSGGQMYDIDGYRQSEKYFAEHAEDIRQQFHFKEDITARIQQLVPEVQHPNSIAVHVRRGDYITPPHDKIYTQCSTQYFQTAVDLIRKQVDDPRAPVIVCSDDMKWCRDTFSNKIQNAHFSPFAQSPIDDFVLLQQCHHQVMSNSSYSWWSAWLKQPDERGTRVIVAPSPWYQQGAAVAHTDDIYCDPWHVCDAATGRLVRAPTHVKSTDWLFRLFGQRAVTGSQVKNNSTATDLYGEAYCISLDSQPERLARALDLCRKTGIVGAQHFRAVDKSIINVDEVIAQGVLAAKNEMFSTQASSLGSLGCLMSHCCIWAAVVERNLECCTVFEDDITTYIGRRDLEKRVKQMRRLVGRDWDFIFLGKCIDKCQLYDKLAPGMYRSYAPSCTHAYIISNRGARKMLRCLPLSTGIDTEIARRAAAKLIKCYVFQPSIFVQDIMRFNSNLRNFGLQITNANDCAT